MLYPAELRALKDLAEIPSSCASNSAGTLPALQEEAITLARFWSKVEVGDLGACWPWRAGLVAGKEYGRFGREKAHRVAYRLIVGPIPAGLLVRHLCNNPRCCNPMHLALGTTAENAADCRAAGRQAVGMKNGRTKLTPEQVAMIRSSPRTGIELARDLGVSEATISGIRTFRHRRHG